MKAPGTVAPLNGTSERYKLISSLNYIASELHPSFGFRFYPIKNPDSDLIPFREKRIQAKLKYLNDVELKDKSFVIGNSFTIVDSYLYVVLTWLKPEDLVPYPAVKAYFEGIKNLPIIAEARAKMASNPATTA